MRLSPMLRILCIQLMTPATKTLFKHSSRSSNSLLSLSILPSLVSLRLGVNVQARKTILQYLRKRCRCLRGLLDP